MKKYTYKVGDKVLLTNKRPRLWNREGAMDKYLNSIVTISRILPGGQTFKIKEDNTLWKWNFRFDEIVKKINGKHFKSYPNNYTGILNIENGRVIEETKKEILDETEKEYLEAVFKPFKNKVIDIRKEESPDGNYYIYANIGFVDAMILPNFPRNSKMYIGMEPGEKYTLKELGLFEEE